MAINNYFPATYQPMTGYPMQTAANSPSTFVNPAVSQPTSSILWVQGENAAKSYPVASGNSVLLMDSEERKFYIKSTDNSGMPLPLRRFNYTEITEETKEEQTTINTADFITREEFEQRLSQLNHRRDYKKERNNG